MWHCNAEEKSSKKENCNATIIDNLNIVMQRYRMRSLLQFEQESIESSAVMSVRDIPLDQMQQWIADDEQEAGFFWDNVRIFNT